jgi:hypothetical protein
VRGGIYPCLIILLPSQNPRSLGPSPLGLTSLKRKNHPIVVTLGGIGSCYASLALKPQVFILSTNCAITSLSNIQKVTTLSHIKLPWDCAQSLLGNAPSLLPSFLSQALSKNLSQTLFNVSCTLLNAFYYNLKVTLHLLQP